ncbi:MAG: glutamine--fructose-6-phosphate transaminase (isomerizing) [Xanthobacteraceae bacterium]|nr:glutamine--fructose-6-phosphate transaminase (isomerizing) [Xanthobacteraceae bacterium]
MCGIVGMLGKAAVADQIIEALRRLEYRGYDSAGVATLENGCIQRRRAAGKLRNLELCLSQAPLSGAIGIGHTRWATHGSPTEINAHPHATEKLAVVHNGIIENFRTLKSELQANGVCFETETDTEVVARLVTEEMNRGKSPADAVAAILPRLHGAYALAFLFAGENDLLIGARHGPPLAIGLGEGENYLGSDALALAPLTNRIIYLEDGDWTIVSRGEVEIRDAGGRIAKRPVIWIPTSGVRNDRGNYRHFMEKEIHEQPEAIQRTLEHYVDLASGRIANFHDTAVDWRSLTRVSIAACGTAYFAGLVAKYWFERLAHLTVQVEFASEFRYRDAPLDPSALMTVVSQSGETADTLASLRYAKSFGVPVLAVVNVPTSSIARESTIVCPTFAGPEIAVASTKAFTCQLVVLLCLALQAARARGVLGESDEKAIVRELIEVPRLVAATLKNAFQIERIAREIANVPSVIYVGRGTSYPLAMEGALKLKELSYIHAEGYAAGELKHGPIALVDNTRPVIVIAPQDPCFEKTAANMQEVAARGGKIVLITDAGGAKAIGLDTLATLIMTDMHPVVSPIVYAVPVQILAYSAAALMGKDVDQPRNLAKSVTVE